MVNLQTSVKQSLTYVVPFGLLSRYSRRFEDLTEGVKFNKRIRTEAGAIIEDPIMAPD